MAWAEDSSAGTADEVAIQQSVFTRKGVERVVRYAFDAARRRPRKRLASATKSNAMQYTMTLWDEVVREVGREYPDISVASYHVDALAARMITHPESLDVVVASNLFADILTDLGGALQGSLGLAASANVNPGAHRNRRATGAAAGPAHVRAGPRQRAGHRRTRRRQSHRGHLGGLDDDGTLRRITSPARA